MRKFTAALMKMDPKTFAKVDFKYVDKQPDGQLLKVYIHVYLCVCMYIFVHICDYDYKHEYIRKQAARWTAIKSML